MAHKSPHPPALLLKEKGAKLLYFRSFVFKKGFKWLTNHLIPPPFSLRRRELNCCIFVALYSKKNLYGSK